MILDQVKHHLVTVGHPSVDKPIFMGVSIGSHYRIAMATEFMFNSVNKFWEGDYFWVIGGDAVPPPIKNGYLLFIEYPELHALSAFTTKAIFTLKTVAPFFIEPRDLVYADLDCLFLKNIGHRIKQDKLTITREGFETGPINGGLFICPPNKWDDLKLWHDMACQALNKTDQRILKWLIQSNKIDVNYIDDMVYYPWCMRDFYQVPLMSDENNEWKQYEVLHLNTKTWRWRLRSMHWYWNKWIKDPNSGCPSDAIPAFASVSVLAPAAPVHSVPVGKRTPDMSKYGISSRSSINVTYRNLLVDILLNGDFQNVLEVGCLRGYSSCAFVEALNCGCDFRYTICDPAPHTDFGFLELCEKSNNITIERKKSVDVINPGFDFIFLDGDHTTCGVGQEIMVLIDTGIQTMLAHDTYINNPRMTGSHLYRYFFQRHRDFHYVDDNTYNPANGEIPCGISFFTKNIELYKKVYPMFQKMIAERPPIV